MPHPFSSGRLSRVLLAVLPEATDLEAATTAFSLRFSQLSLLAVVLLLVVAVLLRRPTEWVKRVLFWSIVGLVAATTVVLAGLTFWLNTVSVSKGPVHWHADFEVWYCGQKLDLVDPKGRFSNKVGTPTRHEHNDNRLHFEGVLVDWEQATLTSFFRALGVTLTPNELIFPTNQRTVLATTGDPCPDGTIGTVQVFAFRTDPATLTFRQDKVDPSEARISPHSRVPPGDCFIIEFGSERERTDRLCQSYQVALELGKLRGDADGQR